MSQPENIEKSFAEQDLGKLARKGLRLLSRVSTRDRVVFSRQLSVMISANVPLLRALRSMVQQTENPALKDIVENLADEIEGGAKLSDAMALHSDAFSEFYISMVRSGETTGRIDQTLNYLADEQEKDYELMSKIRGSMIYPAFIICGLLAVGVLMMVFVIPKLTDILQESGATLPWTTRALIFTSGFMTGYWWLILIAFVLAVVGLRVVLQIPAGRLIWDSLKIHLPLFGKIFRKIYIVRLTRTLSTLITGGVDIVSGLTVVSNVVGNAVYKKMIVETISEVEDGNSITTVFRESKLIPPMVVQMIAIGEETGQMAFVLEKLTDFFSREVRTLVESLVTVIEPAIMIVMGVAVGIMVSAVLMPMYNLASEY
ncbi:MAG: type II secretion system F family protein [Patescibacteria group bacterium]|nr:type II secretion system F family protein [Patescibacteria group bacterium]